MNLYVKKSGNYFSLFYLAVRSIIARPRGVDSETSQLSSYGNEEKMKKRVRFQDDELSRSMNDFITSSNASKRLPYNPKSVNMFQNIIPESYLARDNHINAAGKSGKGTTIPGTPMRKPTSTKVCISSL